MIHLGVGEGGSLDQTNKYLNLKSHVVLVIYLPRTYMCEVASLCQLVSQSVSNFEKKSPPSNTLQIDFYNMT